MQVLSFGIELGSRFWYVMLCGLDMVAYAGAGPQFEAWFCHLWLEVVDGFGYNTGAYAGSLYGYGIG